MTEIAVICYISWMPAQVSAAALLVCDIFSPPFRMNMEAMLTFDYVKWL